MKKYFFNNKQNLFLYVLLSIATYGCLTGVYQMYSLVTEATETSDYNKAYNTLLFGVVVLALLFGLLILMAVVKRVALSNITMELRNDIIEHVAKMNIHSFGTKETSFYTSMIVNDVEMLEESYFDKVFELIGDCIQLVVMLFSITLIGWEYTLVVMGFAILSAIQPIVLKKKLAEGGVKVSNELEEYTASVKEHIQAFDTIKSFQAKNVFFKMFLIRVDELEERNEELWRTKMWNTILVLISVYSLKVGTQLFFAYNALTGVISVAVVALLFGLANNVGNPIIAVLSYLEPINSTKSVRKKVEDFCNDESSVEINGNQIMKQDGERIIMENLSFGYEADKNVLDGVNLSFEKGKKYALVGESGSGKSTILKILMGYYNDYSGKLLFGDHELRNIDKKTLRNDVTFITQVPYLFRGTVRDNVLFGKKDYSDKQIWDVLEKSKIKNMVLELPNGLEEEIIAGSNNISGGEKQRLCIARALLRNTDIVLMDEGTSALDNVTAVAVEKEILNDCNRTFVAVLHRFNETIKQYDCIYFLEKGKIVEAGNYDQLMEKNGKFKMMLAAQGGLE